MEQQAASTATAPDGDPTNPAHYASLRPEPIDVIEGWNLGPHEANIVKYISRWKVKGGARDLRKARWYLERLIARVEAARG